MVNPNPQYPPPYVSWKPSGGISKNAVKALVKKFSKACCPPVYAETALISVNTGLANFAIGPFLATKLETGATAKILQSLGTPTDVTIDSFAFVDLGNGLQTVTINATIDTPDDGQEFRVFIENPCGCCAFVGDVLFSQS